MSEQSQNTTIQNESNEIYQGFMIKKIHVPTENGLVEQTIICFDKEDLIINSLQDITSLDVFYEDEVYVRPQNLYPYLKAIQQKVDAGDYYLIDLLCYLNTFFASELKKVENMTKSNKINFDNLESVFTIGTKFVAYIHNNQMVGSIVHSVNKMNTITGRVLEIVGVFNVPIGEEIRQIRRSFYINEFGGVMSIDDLEVRPMRSEDEEFLRKRGDIFAKFAIGSHYYEYNGTMCYKTNFGYQYFKADGRIMIDAIGFEKMNPSYLSGLKTNSTVVQTINETNSFMCWPYMYGFSFSAKRWGELNVDRLKEIKFDDNAFNYLVLDMDIKKMMKALIINVKHSFKDIIGGKSGGCIFMLHGPPGVGKTLTCEAVAELLHKPLYSITVGELGTSTELLEKRLNNILEIANSWDAVILIDEADIFMEARNKNDIERNGMVSIFLRLLERHQGVMFLTTNRIDELDMAFKSRISIMIGYDNLDYEARKTVWSNLLKAADISLNEDDIHTLAAHYINGRQIKNAIRMTQSLIADKDYNTLGKPAQLNDFNFVLKYNH